MASAVGEATWAHGSEESGIVDPSGSIWPSGVCVVLPFWIQFEGAVICIINHLAPIFCPVIGKVLEQAHFPAENVITVHVSWVIFIEVSEGDVAHILGLPVVVQRGDFLDVWSTSSDPFFEQITFFHGAVLGHLEYNVPDI